MFIPVKFFFSLFESERGRQSVDQVKSTVREYVLLPKILNRYFTRWGEKNATIHQMFNVRINPDDICQQATVICQNISISEKLNFQIKQGYRYVPHDILIVFVDRRIISSQIRQMMPFENIAINKRKKKAIQPSINIKSNYRLYFVIEFSQEHDDLYLLLH